MKRNLEQLDVNALQRMFIEETKRFLSAIEKGESWYQLERRRSHIKEIGSIMDKKTKGCDPASTCRSF